MGNNYESPLWAPEGVYAVGHYFKGVYVESGVGLVQNRELGLEYLHLKYFVLLFLASREPLVYGAFQKVIGHSHYSHFFLGEPREFYVDRKSTRLNSSHSQI